MKTWDKESWVVELDRLRAENADLKAELSAALELNERCNAENAELKVIGSEMEDAVRTYLTGHGGFNRSVRARWTGLCDRWKSVAAAEAAKEKK